MPMDNYQKLEKVGEGQSSSRSHAPPASVALRQC